MFFETFRSVSADKANLEKPSIVEKSDGVNKISEGIKIESTKPQEILGVVETRIVDKRISVDDLLNEKNNLLTAQKELMAFIPFESQSIKEQLAEYAIDRARSELGSESGLSNVDKDPLDAGRRFVSGLYYRWLKITKFYCFTVSGIPMSDVSMTTMRTNLSPCGDDRLGINIYGSRNELCQNCLVTRDLAKPDENL